VVKLGEGLYVLPMTFQADGRASTDRPQDRGVTTMNSYLFTEPGSALLLEAGVSVHEQEILRTLESLIDARTTLSIWAMRIQEYAAIANVRPIVERFSVDAVYSAIEDGAGWTDFRPEYAPFGTPRGAGRMGAVESRVIRKGDTIRVGSGDRVISVVDAPLRMLPLNWAYDEKNKALFTADAFAYARDRAGDVAVITEDNDDLEPESIWTQLVESRFWWLPGARTRPIREGHHQLRADHEIEIIAPAYGCVLRGRSVVDRHLEMMDDLLAAAETQDSIGLEVGSWSLHAVGSGVQ